MRILFRYVLREFCVPLFYCLAGFMALYVLFDLFGSFGRLASAHPRWQDVILYFCGYLSPYFRWMAPACLMLATLYTMWSFCRHSEITAMRASGIGFYSIVKPLLFVASLVAAFTWWVDESYVPRYAQRANAFRDARFRREKMKLADNVVFRNKRAERMWNVGSAIDEGATALEDVTVTECWPGGERRRTIKSPRAAYLDGQWWFSDPEIFHFDHVGNETASSVPALDALRFRCFPEFDEMPRDFVLMNRDANFYSVADRARELAMHPDLSAESRNGKRYDLWAQALAPLACLVITLFAIPAGIATGRQSVFRGILAALGMFFAFYAVTIACMVGAKRGWIPPVPAAFFPHLIFLAIGCVTFWRQR